MPYSVPSVTARCLPSGAQPPATTNQFLAGPGRASTPTGAPTPSDTWKMRPGQPAAMRVPSGDQAIAGGSGGKGGDVVAAGHCPRFTAACGDYLQVAPRYGLGVA